MKLSPAETLWVYRWLAAAQKVVPKGSEKHPHLVASSFSDAQGCFHDLVYHAQQFRDEVSKALTEIATTGKKPKMQSKPAWWLGERIAMAMGDCASILRLGKHLASPLEAQRPKDALKAIEWLLLDQWDERFAKLWAKDNAAECIYPREHYEEAYYGVQNFLESIRA